MVVTLLFAWLLPCYLNSCYLVICSYLHGCSRVICSYLNGCYLVICMVVALLFE